MLYNSIPLTKNIKDAPLESPHTSFQAFVSFFPDCVLASVLKY